MVNRNSPTFHLWTSVTKKKKPAPGGEKLNTWDPGKVCQAGQRRRPNRKIAKHTKRLLLRVRYTNSKGSPSSHAITFSFRRTREWSYCFWQSTAFIKNAAIVKYNNTRRENAYKGTLQVHKYRNKWKWINGKESILLYWFLCSWSLQIKWLVYIVSLLFKKVSGRGGGDYLKGLLIWYYGLGGGRKNVSSYSK